MILDDVFCRSRYSYHRMYCPRSIFAWWREVWLERVSADARDNVFNTPTTGCSQSGPANDDHRHFVAAEYRANPQGPQIGDHRSELAEMYRDLSQTIRSRVPLRLGLAGGGTDLSPYSEVYGGAVLNCTIDRYAYAFISPRADDKIAFRARDLSTDELHDVAPAIAPTSGLLLHRGVYNRMVREFCGGEPLAVTVSTTVDAPPGSGLGSSSALVVALVEAFRAYLDLPLGRYDVAHLAHDIERKDLELAGGKQDQYAAAFGGVNFIEFLPDDRTIVNPLRLNQDVLNEFEASLVVCFTGVSRGSDKIIREQTVGIKQSSEETLKALHQLKADAVAMKRTMLAGDMRSMATILARSWIAKKQTAGRGDDGVDR